jgi:hypothetical protein
MKDGMLHGKMRAGIICFSLKGFFPDLMNDPQLVGRLTASTLLYDGRFRLDLVLVTAPFRALYRAWDLDRQRAITVLELATPSLAVASAAIDRAAPLVESAHPIMQAVQVVWIERGTIFLALGIAGGQTIERIVAERASPVAAGAAARWIAEAADGVQGLAGWHLGDLSASALLVTAEDRIQLLGFELPLGLAAPEQIAAALPAGSVAPELHGGGCDARSDVFSLAETLHLMLAGRLWTDSGPLDQTGLAAVRPDLAPEVIAVLARGLEPVPDDRWPDVAAFREALLAAFVEGRSPNGAPGDIPVADLAEEPPTLISSRDALRDAVAAEAASRGVPMEDLSLQPAEPEPPGAIASYEANQAGLLDDLPAEPAAAGEFHDIVAFDASDLMMEDAIEPPGASPYDMPIVLLEPIVTEMPPEPPPQVVQVIIAHDVRLQKAAARPPAAEKSLLDRLRGVLRRPPPASASATIVLPRHMIVNQNYSALVRVHCQAYDAPAGTPLVIHLEIASSEGLYVPVHKLAQSLPVAGGVSEVTASVTAGQAESAHEWMRFVFRDDEGNCLHEGDFLAEIAIIGPHQTPAGPTTATLLRALTIPALHPQP